MKSIILQMGCLPSRSTIAPAKFNRVESRSDVAKETANGDRINQHQAANGVETNEHPTMNAGNESTGVGSSLILAAEGSNEPTASGANEVERKSKSARGKDAMRNRSNNSSIEGPEDELMSILINESSGAASNADKWSPTEGINLDQHQLVNGRSESISNSLRGTHNDTDGTTGSSQMEKEEPEKRGSFEGEPNMELLRQYVAIDYEIMQFEDKDALRVYHEKIEQLEQLERELDMISSEADEVARGSGGGSQMGDKMDFKMDQESNSILSGVTGSISHRSLLAGNGPAEGNQPATDSSPVTTERNDSRRNPASQHSAAKDLTRASSQRRGLTGGKLSYSTIEDVFNRKIILEKERDKLKMEVEQVIVECDKLQQRYKKRDEILDKLFDGRNGNGLENHLEQQLNWLLEQKHYVDQVFYAWKRAETLTNQTCEQFASALELLKKLTKTEDQSEQQELLKSVEQLLIKSRQDMELAQKYNPNVDAPFFTENETKRFNRIIDTISSNPPSNAAEYSQIMTVVQFAYKRAISIRLWLEQILQTTIARDSFELAEEYKWIAIQLRKERINLIKSMLQESPYRSMAQSVQEQIARQQKLAEQRRQNEVNRDSGIESETNDIDIEEEIYRVLEMNRSRLEAPNGAEAVGSNPNAHLSYSQLKVDPQNGASATSSSDSGFKNQSMQDMIDRRVKGDRPLHLSKIPSHIPLQGDNNDNEDKLTGSAKSATSMQTSPTPARLKVELDEESRRNLLEQVHSIHDKHRSKIERLRGSNLAKTSSFIKGRMENAASRQTLAKEHDPSDILERSE